MLAGDCIDGDNIQNDVINSEHYAAGSIDTEHYAANSVDLAAMAGVARGKLIVGDSNGDPSYLNAGSNDHVLTMDANGDVGWEAAAGGGKLLQFVNGTTSSLTNNTSQDNTYINHYLTITPVASDSTLVFCLGMGVQRENQQTGFTLAVSIDDGSSFYHSTGGGDYGWHDSGGQSNDMYWVEGPFYWTRTAGTAGSAETHKIYVEQRTADSTGYDLHTRSSFVCWEIEA